MTERVFLHVGPHKTGTTFVQGLLIVNREPLARQGVLYPLRTFAAQGKAVRGGLGRDGGGPAREATAGAWDRLLGELAEWTGPAAVVSHETLSSATPKEIARVSRAFARFELHVIYTARDLTRVAPAMWQTGLRSRQRFTWDQYAASLRHPGGLHGRWGRAFWHAQDAPALLARWGKRVPPAQLHVVTVPPPGNPPELLWQRFCSVLGVDPSGHDLRPPRSNPSLGTAEAELLRRVNEAVRAARPGPAGPEDLMRVSRWLGRQLETRPQASRFGLPAEDYGWLAERARAVAAGLEAGGWDIVGDVEDLLPRPAEPGRDRHPSDTTDDAVLDVAVDAVHRLVVELIGRESRQSDTGRESRQSDTGRESRQSGVARQPAEDPA